MRKYTVCPGAAVNVYAFWPYGVSITPAFRAGTPSEIRSPILIRIVASGAGFWLRDSVVEPDGKDVDGESVLFGWRVSGDTRRKMFLPKIPVMIESTMMTIRRAGNGPFATRPRRGRGF